MIAAVKNEHSVDELSTPYKRILLNQIQQHLSSPLPSDGPVGEPSPLITSGQMANSEESSLSQSFDSALSHRKKAVPCKYIPAADEGEHYSCDRCNQTFEDQCVYEQHACIFEMPQLDMGSAKMESADLPTDNELYPCERCGKAFEHQILYEQHDCNVSDNGEIEDQREQNEDVASVEIDVDEDSNAEKELAVGMTTEKPTSPERVNDVISAISERAEAVGTSGSVKGSAIAQVISGLLGANKHSNNSSSSNSNLPAVHMQSIST